MHKKLKNKPEAQKSEHIIGMYFFSNIIKEATFVCPNYKDKDEIDIQELEYSQLNTQLITKENTTKDNTSIDNTIKDITTKDNKTKDNTTKDNTKPKEAEEQNKNEEVEQNLILDEKTKAMCEKVKKVAKFKKDNKKVESRKSSDSKDEDEKILKRLYYLTNPLIIKVPDRDIEEFELRADRSSEATKIKE